MLLKWIENLFLPKILNGVISDELKGTEFLYGEIPSINPDTLPDVNGVMPEFNQGKLKLTAQACTIVNSIRNILYIANSIRGYKATSQDIIDAVEYAKTEGYVVGSGWFVYKGVDAARNWWNTNHPTMQVSSYVILQSDPDFSKLMLKGYSMTGSYNGSTEYGRDYRSDAVLDGAKFGERTYGHCTIRRNLGNLVVDDSYTGNFYNVYKIMQPKELIENNVWSAGFFFFAPKNDNSARLKELNKFKLETETSIQANSNARHLTNDVAYQKFLNTTNTRLRAKLIEIKEQISKL